MLEYFGTVFFLLEMGVRIIAYGPKLYFFQPMCLMDAFIVLIDLVKLLSLLSP